MPIEERFQFWNQIRNAVESARLDLTQKLKNAPDSIKKSVEDQSTVQELILRLHQCLHRSTDRYIDALNNLEKLEESVLAEA